MKDETLISINSVIDAIAGNLRDKAGATYVYNNPNQQNTQYPCWFINLVPTNSIDRVTMARNLRSLTIDLVYHEQINEIILFDNYIAQAEILDEKLLFIDYPYSFRDDEGNTISGIAKIRTIERHWTIDRTALHYMFTLPFHVTIKEEEHIKMMRIEELNETVTIYEDWR